jgi:hypothetical protein
VLVLRISALVRRDSAGEEGTIGRCWSKLDRPDCRLLGGGGGGGIVWLLALSLDTMRLLRFDEMDEVRRMSIGEAGSDSASIVLRRLEDGPLRVEFERWGSSLLEELGLDVGRSVKRAPWRERGGGGGDFTFAMDEVSLVLGVGLSNGGSTECWDEIVRLELLRDLFPVVEDRS